MLENHASIKEGVGVPCPLGPKCKVPGYHLNHQRLEALRRYGLANFRASTSQTPLRSLDVDHLSEIDSDRFQLFTMKPVCVCCWEPISKSKSEIGGGIEANTDTDIDDSNGGSIQRLHSLSIEEAGDVSIPRTQRSTANNDSPTVTLSCSHTVHNRCLLSTVRRQRLTEPPEQYLHCPYSPLCAAMLAESDLSSLSGDSNEITIDELEKLRALVFKPVVDLEDTTDAFIIATTKACPNQACRMRVTHYHGHSCHHIMPTPFCNSCQRYACVHGKRGCPGCGLHYCYRCEQTEVLVLFHLKNHYSNKPTSPELTDILNCTGTKHCS